MKGKLQFRNTMNSTFFGKKKIKKIHFPFKRKAFSKIVVGKFYWKTEKGSSFTWSITKNTKILDA
jgi:hypothetical protein